MGVNPILFPNISHRGTEHTEDTKEEEKKNLYSSVFFEPPCEVFFESVKLRFIFFIEVEEFAEKTSYNLLNTSKNGKTLPFGLCRLLLL
jgi:hypothetical protein